MKKHKVFISPLNWGLGHATRCIPIIRYFLKNGWDVVIGAEEPGYTLLQKEFPDLLMIHFPGIRVTYSHKIPVAFKLLLQAPRILLNIFSEHLRLQKIIDAYRIDLVVSDNRYGLWTNKIPSIFMTHQLHIRPPKSLRVAGPFILRLNKYFIRRFTRIWVPDFFGALSVAGALSQPPIHKSTDYIGTLSRFSKRGEPVIFDFLIIISGPEPQRTVFEEKVRQSLHQVQSNGIVVRGVPQAVKPYEIHSGTEIFSHLTGKKLEKIANQARTIICRSGYSTVMDLLAIGKPAVFVPTPGQTEQEYLAEYLMGNSFIKMNQKDFNLKEALRLGKTLQAPDFVNSLKTEKNIDESLKKINMNPN